MLKKSNINKYLQKGFYWFMPNRNSYSDFDQSRLKILNSVHLILLAFATAIIFLNLYVVPENEVPTFLPFFGILGLQFYFRQIGNLSVSTNFVCLIVFFAVGPSIPTSGGLYSDNLVWLLIVPVLAFLISNKWSGLIWTVVIFTTLTYFYHLELNAEESYRTATLTYSPTYYFVSWAFLFGVISLIIFFFAKGKNQLINELIESKKTLTLQKEKITVQAKTVKDNEKELIVLNKKLEHFAIAISHDLKEPLRTIKLYTQMIERKLTNSLSEKDREYMTFITDGTDRMHNLLVDLLAYVRLDESQANKTDLALDDVLILVKNDLYARISQNNTQILIKNELPIIHANQSQLVLLFQNIINNAIKFRHKDRPSIIEISVTNDDLENQIIHVTDNGIGIEKEYLDKIFELFNKIHNKEQYEGTGIGLATCKKIMEDLDGSICVDSEFGKHTTFHLLFPKQSIVLPLVNTKELEISQI